jgi:replication-associated recombination protein RarA
MNDNGRCEAAIAINATVLESLRTRRSAGESLGRLAKEIGLPWQRLWTLLYPAGPKVKSWPTVRPNSQAGSLTERYRPTSLDAIWGQDAVVNVLRRFAANPYPSAFIFEGETGTGKTSAALSLASAIGCDLSQKEFGGVQAIASGEQSADTVREAYRQMFNTPWHGSGWKVVIVNEADRMARPAETIWLDVLEAIPARTVVIFTTNEAGRLSQRFLDRCTRLAFESDADKLRASAIAFASAVWKAETGKRPDTARIQQIVQATEAQGQLSFRRLVQQLTVALVSENGHE